jgi:hypothetical protein
MRKPLLHVLFKPGTWRESLILGATITAALLILTWLVYCTPFSKLPLREWRGRDARLR